MNKPLLLNAVATFGLTMAAADVAALDLTLALGTTGDASETARIALQKDFDRSWFQTDTGRLTGYWDLGYTYWFDNDRSDNHSLAVSPVLVYEFAGERFRPYGEIGIGLAVFADTRVEDNDLASAFQFEDRIGFGVRFGRHEVGARAIHYSNARIKQPNQGVESYAIHYRLSF